MKKLLLILLITTLFSSSFAEQSSKKQTATEKQSHPTQPNQKITDSEIVEKMMVSLNQSPQIKFLKKNKIQINPIEVEGNIPISTYRLENNLKMSLKRNGFSIKSDDEIKELFENYELKKSPLYDPKKAPKINQSAPTLLLKGTIKTDTAKDGETSTAIYTFTFQIVSITSKKVIWKHTESVENQATKPKRKD